MRAWWQRCGYVEGRVVTAAVDVAAAAEAKVEAPAGSSLRTMLAARWAMALAEVAAVWAWWARSAASRSLEDFLALVAEREDWFTHVRWGELARGLGVNLPSAARFSSRRAREPRPDALGWRLRLEIELELVETEESEVDMEVDLSMVTTVVGAVSAEVAGAAMGGKVWERASLSAACPALKPATYASLPALAAARASETGAGGSARPVSTAKFTCFGAAPMADGEAASMIWILESFSRERNFKLRALVLKLAY